MLIRPVVAYAPDDLPAGGGGSDQPAPGEDTQAPPASTPEGTAGFESPSIDYEKRYKDVQAWSTKLSQENATLKERAALLDALESDDPRAQAEALARFGIQLDYEDEQAWDTGEQAQQQQVPGVDPETLQKLEYFIAQQEAQEAARQEQEDYQAYRSQVDPELERMGLPAELHDIVAEAALHLPGVPDEFGQVHPDLEAAIGQVTELAQTLGKLPGVEQQRLQAYRASKQAPAISESGTAGTQVPDLTDAKQRQQFMRERFAAFNNDAA